METQFATQGPLPDPDVPIGPPPNPDDRGQEEAPPLDPGTNPVNAPRDPRSALTFRYLS